MQLSITFGLSKSVDVKVSEQSFRPMLVILAVLEKLLLVMDFLIYFSFHNINEIRFKNYSNQTYVVISCLFVT